MEKQNNAKISWEIEEELSDQIDKYCENVQQNVNLLKAYAPKYAHPEDFTRLPPEITSGARNHTGSPKPNNTRINHIKFDIGEVSEDQSDSPPVTLHVSNISVNANTRKRVHVPDEEEERLANVPERKTMTQDSGSPIPETVWRGNNGSDDPEVHKPIIRQKIKDNIRTKKIGITIADIMTLDPVAGKEIAEGMADLADRISVTSYQKVTEETHQQGRNTTTDSIHFDGQDWSDSYFNNLSKKAGITYIQIDISEEDQEPNDHTGPNRTEPRLERGEYEVIENKDTSQETREIISVNDLHHQGVTEIHNFNTKDKPVEEELNDLTINTVGMDFFLRPGDRTLAQAQELPKIMVRLNNPDGMLVEAIVDTGSEGNMISERIARQYKLKVTPMKVTTTSYTSNKLTILGQTGVKVYLASTWVPQQLFIAPKGAVSVNFILEMPFIRSTRATFDNSPKDRSILLIYRLGTTRLITPAAGSVR
jgi:hypothetical protein